MDFQLLLTNILAFIMSTADAVHNGMSAEEAQSLIQQAVNGFFSLDGWLQLTIASGALAWPLYNGIKKVVTATRYGTYYALIPVLYSIETIVAYIRYGLEYIIPTSKKETVHKIHTEVPLDKWKWYEKDVECARKKDKFSEYK